MLLALASSLYATAVSGQQYSPSTLTLYVFSDGSVNVEYVIEPDPTLARVNVSLQGDSYEDLLVVDPDGVILDWDPVLGGVEVDALGADEITISYSTNSLTNKTGSMWSVSASSTVNAIITLPRDAVLVGLSPAPIDISIVDGKAAVTMPPGASRVSYMLGTTGTREHALILLNAAEETVAEAKLMELMVDDAEELLAQARDAYADKLYSQSEQLSLQATEAAKETMETAAKAMDAITETVNLIEDKTGRASPEALAQASSLLETAAEEYAQGDYLSAWATAEEAYQLALAAEPEAGGDNTLLMAGGAVAVLLAAGFIYLSRRQKGEPPVKPESQAPDVDLDRVFRNMPHLRTDDKAVLRFIDESGGAFITEVRERFDIPKSSAWRMIRRLEEEGLLEVTTVGRETYVQLRDPEG